jgi:hypothetical protein
MLGAALLPAHLPYGSKAGAALQFYYDYLAMAEEKNKEI